MSSENPVIGTAAGVFGGGYNGDGGASEDEDWVDANSGAAGATVGGAAAAGTTAGGDSGKKSEIADLDLRARYSRTFIIVTYLLITLGLVALGFAAYSFVESFTGDKTFLKISSGIVIGVLVLIIVVFILYYLYIVQPELRRTDVLVTDLVRRSTVKSTENSFKNNLASIIASKTRGNFDALEFVKNHIGFTNEGRKRYRDWFDAGEGVATNYQPYTGFLNRPARKYI